MLNELAIKNFAIIDDLRISFNDDFTVLTGETGAGKSIIIEAVNLLLGARASADLVRNGCDQAELEAVFDIDEGSVVSELMAEQGMDASEGLMIRRVVSASGKSRVYVNSRQSTLELLKSISQDLAGISSQHAHQGLLKEENHLDILDEFAGTRELRAGVGELYNKLVPLKTRVAELADKLERRKKEQEFLQFQVDEISDADIQPDEDEILAKKRKTLLSASQIFETLNRSVHEIQDRENSMVEKLSALGGDLQRFSDADQQLDSIVQRLSSIQYDLQDLVQEFRDYSSAIDLDPASLEETEQRIDLISKLKRKYGGSLESLFEEWSSLEKKLGQTDEIEKEIKLCKEESIEFQEQIIDAAVHLSELRIDAAKQLSKLAQKELEGLEMGKTRFEVQFETREAQSDGDIATPEGVKIGPGGIDEIRFLLSPNPGEPLKPLTKIASGGELSRIVLALKAVLSKTKSLETLVFDEVDAGIGGATSEKVGLKLKQLSEKHQVICITHLAQIAKYGQSQFRISKDVDDGRTFTSIVPLETLDSRVEEIARMIGGTDITQATLAHARELLDHA